MLPDEALDNRTSTLREPPTIHAFVISWTGYADKAEEIARQLHSSVTRLTVIHSERSAIRRDGSGEWLNVPDSHFFGLKFATSLVAFTGDILLQIQADADCRSWPGLVKKAQSAFETRPSLGVWTPQVDYTPQPLDRTNLLQETPHEYRVALTDGIVWALSATVCDRLRELDYRGNNIGWGIDYAASAIALTKGQYALLDSSVKVDHPKSRGYSTDSAGVQMERFLSQLSVGERAMISMIKSRFAIPSPPHSMRTDTLFVARGVVEKALEIARAIGRRTGLTREPVHSLRDPDLAHSDHPTGGKIAEI